MAFRHFNHLNVPEYWERYFTKYPQGMTILESLFDWITQVNNMTDDYNSLTEHVTKFKEAVNGTTDGFRSELDLFLKRFDDNLSEEVIKTLGEWQASGFLDFVIGEALQTEIDTVASLVSQKTHSELMDVRPSGHNNMAAVSFMSDDGPFEDYLILKQYSLMYNIPFSLALTGETTLTDDHIKEAYSLGWDFGSHGMYHIDMATATHEQIDYHMKESKKVLAKRGISTDYFVYPHNSHGATARKLARKYYKFALAGVGIPVKYPAQSYIIERVEIPSIAGQDTLEYYKEMFDRAVLENKWIVFFMHANSNAFDDQQKQNLHMLIQYIQTTNVPIVNVTDGYRMFGNAISTPDADEFDAFRITNKGDITGKSGTANAVQIGIEAKTVGSFATAIGNGALATGVQSTGIGFRANAKGDYSTVLGQNTYAENQSTALGSNAKANGGYSTVIGASSSTVGQQATSVGYSTVATGEFSSAIGSSASSVGDRSVAIGNRSVANAGNTVALGYLSKALSPSSVSIGETSEASANYGVAIGASAKAGALNTVAIGRGAIAETEGDFVLGATFNRVIIPSNKLHLKSPNGTRYYIHITDTGVVSATVG